MKRFILLAGAVALALPAAAAAKGPSAASIDGPGTGGGISIGGGGGGDPSPGTPLGDLTMSGGFFQTTFGQSPDYTTRERPKGELGPKYTVTYTVPGPNGEVDRLTQDVYPYAEPSPVTYMRPGQPFFGTERTHGGWFVASPELKSALVDAGLPPAPPSASSGASLPRWSAGLIVFAAAILLLLGTTLALRRRPKPASA